MLETGEWNKVRIEAIIEGRYNFKTGEITPASEVNESVEPQLKSFRQRFVRRATRLDGSNGKKRRIITKEPESHSDNHPVVTGQRAEAFSNIVRRPKERYHIWERFPDGRFRRPVIPAGELRTPTITGIESIELEGLSRPEDLLKSPVMKMRTPSKPHVNGDLPNGYTVGDNARITFLNVIIKGR